MTDITFSLAPGVFKIAYKNAALWTNFHELYDAGKNHDILAAVRGWGKRGRI